MGDFNAEELVKDIRKERLGRVLQHLEDGSCSTENALSLQPLSHHV